MKNKKTRLLDAEKKDNRYVTMEEINNQEEKVKKLKTLVNCFSAPADKELQLDNMIDVIVSARSKQSEGEMEVRSFYGLNNGDKMKMKTLSALAVEGERIRM